MNKVIVMGNVGKDPEVKTTQGGAVIASFSVATRERRKEAGEWKDHSEWHNVTAFGKTAENIGKYVSKGHKILVEGRLTTDKYTDKNGVERWSTKIIAESVEFLERRGAGAEPSEPVETPAIDDGIPF